MDRSNHDFSILKRHLRFATSPSRKRIDRGLLIKRLLNGGGDLGVIAEGHNTEYNWFTTRFKLRVMEWPIFVEIQLLI
jgi:hypothetical protein